MHEDWAVDEDPAAEALLAVIDAAAIAAGRADQDQAAAAVLLRSTTEETLDAALRLRKLSRRWYRDAVRVFEAAQELERRRELLGVAQGVHAGARARLANAQERCAAANRQLAGADHPG